MECDAIRSDPGLHEGLVAGADQGVSATEGLDVGVVVIFVAKTRINGIIILYLEIQLWGRCSVAEAHTHRGDRVGVSVPFSFLAF